MITNKQFYTKDVPPIWGIMPEPIGPIAGFIMPEPITIEPIGPIWGIMPEPIGPIAGLNLAPACKTQTPAQYASSHTGYTQKICTNIAEKRNSTNTNDVKRIAR